MTIRASGNGLDQASNNGKICVLNRNPVRKRFAVLKTSLMKHSHNTPREKNKEENSFTRRKVRAPALQYPLTAPKPAVAPTRHVRWDKGCFRGNSAKKKMRELQAIDNFCILVCKTRG